MLHRAIPSSGETLPAIGLGSWIQFDVSSHSSDREDLKKVLTLINEKEATLIDS